MLRCLVSYLNSNIPATLLSQRSISYLYRSDIEILLGKKSKITEEQFADIANDKTLSQSVRDYVIGLARLCAPVTTKNMTEIVRKYLAACEVLNDSYHNGHLNFPLQLIAMMNKTEYDAKCAMEALTRCSMRGDLSAIPYLVNFLWEKIEYRPLTVSEAALAIKLAMFYVVNPHYGEEKKIFGILGNLLEFGGFGLSKDFDEACYLYGLNAYNQKSIAILERYPTHLIALITLAEMLQFVAFNGSAMADLRKRVSELKEPKREIVEIYLRYFDIMLLHPHLPNYNEVIKTALIAAIEKQHLLAAKIYLIAARIASNPKDQLEHYKSALAEASLHGQLSGLRIRLTIFQELESRLQRAIKNEHDQIKAITEILIKYDDARAECDSLLFKDMFAKASSTATVLQAVKSESKESKPVVTYFQLSVIKPKEELVSEFPLVADILKEEEDKKKEKLFSTLFTSVSNGLAEAKDVSSKRSMKEP